MTAAGKSPKQTDSAGVTTEYEYYNGDEVTSTSGYLMSAPEGALISQTEGGVTTDFEYDMSPFEQKGFGYEAIAQNFVNYHLYTQSGGTIEDDYGAFPRQTEVKPGYLTSNLVQPTKVKTPAIDASGADVGTNDVSISYKKVAANGWMPDGTGKIYYVTDPEGRNIELAYGSQENAYGEATGPDRNETSGIDGNIGTEVINSYYQTGDFTGRLEESVSLRIVDGETDYLSTTTYQYATTDLNDLGAGNLYNAISSSVPASVLAKMPDDFANLWLDYQVVTTETPTTTTVTGTGIDAGGITLFSGGGPIDATKFDQSVTLSDAEGRNLWSGQFEQQPNSSYIVQQASMSQNEYDPAGLLVKTIRTDSESNATTTEYIYDQQGRQLSTKRDSIVTAETSYEEDGSERSKISTSWPEDQALYGSRSIEVTDANGRVVREESVFVELGGAEIDTTRRVTVYGYDSEGRRNYTRTPRGVQAFITYDAAGRETLKRVNVDGQNIDEWRGYDQYGRNAWTQTALQAKALSYSTYLYKTDYDGNQTNWTTLDDIEPSVSYQHEAVSDPTYGQMVAVYHEDDDEFATNNSSYSGLYEAYEFDTQGRQTAITKPVYKNAANPNVAVTQKTFYYPDGHASEGQIQYVVFNYNESNWTSDKTNQTSTENVQFEFTYDEDGNRETCKYPLGMIKDFTVEEEVYYPEESEFTYSHDARGFIESIQKPEGIINYQQDSFGALSGISYLGHTVNYDYDFFGRLQTASNGETQWNYTYNEAGLKTKVENLGDGTVEDRVYDSLGRLERLTHTDVSTGDVNFESDYIIGPDGNRIGIVEQRNDDYKTWQYEFDELGRLTKELRLDGDFYDEVNEVFLSHVAGDELHHITYTYDADSNRKTELNHKTDYEKEYIYDNSKQQLTSIKRRYQTLAWENYEIYTWTTEGQLETKTDKLTGKTTTYSWGVNDTMTQVDLPDGDRIEYEYDENNTLVGRKYYLAGKNEPAADESYLVDNQNLTGYSQTIAVLDNLNNGAIKTLNTYTDEIKSQTISKTGANHNLHTDGLGSIRSLTSADVSEQHDYTAFGSKLQGSSSLTNYAFTGQVFDVASELQFHRARWLDTKKGSWLTSDPIFDYPINSGNKFTYSGLNPINFSDLNGRVSLKEALITATIVEILLDILAVNIFVFLEKALVSEHLLKTRWQIDIAYKLMFVLNAYMHIAPIFNAARLFSNLVKFTSTALGKSRVGRFLAKGRKSGLGGAGAKFSTNQQGASGFLFYKPTTNSSKHFRIGEGVTNQWGDIWYSSRGSIRDQKLVLFHEQVHQFLSPKFIPLQNWRATKNMRLYNGSPILRYLEESLAETYAQIRVNGLRPSSIIEGIQFPIQNGYIVMADDLIPLLRDTAIGTIVIGTATYFVYAVTNDISEFEEDPF